MSKIEKIKRISVDLLQLKPIQHQKNVYESYNSYLSQFFSDGKPKDKYFQNVTCPICEEGKINKSINIDFFQYVECHNCGTIYNNPQLKSKYLQKMYIEGEYNNYVKSLTIPSDNIRKNLTEVRKVDQVDSLFTSPGSILDVGCGAGVFLKIASDKGWDCMGIELSKSGIESSQEKGIKVIEESFDNFESNIKFDCITFWGVLEHVSEPMNYVRKAVKHLNKNGVIIFEVPSADSILMQYLLRFDLNPYRFIESARHLSFFTRESLEILCKDNNLTLEYIESNGLDLQTILLHEFEDKIVNKLMKIQQIFDSSLISDHYRCFLRKK